MGKKSKHTLVGKEIAEVVVLDSGALLVKFKDGTFVIMTAVIASDELTDHMPKDDPRF